ncbi:enhancer of mRNA-decapping protein 4 [Phymastichus coffea]|uniref:enhancer of mRNA-decapping protein 4 n=1 Tax=Phymastichus coffea TaxID=108790 RepID=UPI00273C345D|nr:enhancer of mRNA-decapping protein 4 [Phymastichus coffea]
MMKSGEDNIRHYVQTVEFTGREDEATVEIISGNVNIIPSSGGHHHGSSKVKLKNIVDFTWEHRYYVGQLLAVHMSGKYLAYGIKAGNGNGVVRVVNKEFELRTLIRGMRGLIQDLAFAHVANPILACVDYTGSLFVYSIEATSTELLCNRILQVDADDLSPMSHRVIWCPYIPEEEASDGEEVSKLLVLTRGSKAELWSIASASRLFAAPTNASDPEISKNGVMLEIYQHSGTIVEATFSPDGTALATASSDGEVKFFQVYLHGTSCGQQPPKCLHKWSPHDGRPISSLFFLDDHENYNPDATFWRFAITGCDNNSELKVWSCELWTCLQTIKFAPMPSSQKMPVLKASLDLAAGYLLLSDIYNKVLYIMSISKDNDEAMACINTVSEFLLPYPILSFAIVDAGQRRLRPTSESLEDLCPCEDENEDQLVIRMYLVQPKSLQECHIAFRLPLQLSGNCLMDTLTHDSLDYTEDLPDISTVHHNGIVGVNDDDDVDVDDGENGEEDTNITEAADLNTNHNAGLNLMTPDAFSSPAKKDGALDSKSSSPHLGNIESASPSIAQTVQALNALDQPLATSKLEEQAVPSGGSSPSREVREILSLADPEENEAEVKTEVPTTTNENWSQIPLCLIKDAIHAMQEQGKDVADGQLGIKKEPAAPSYLAATEDVQTKWNVSNDIGAMSSKLDSVLELMQDQQQELNELRLEMTRLRQETPLAARVESALTKATQQQSTSIEQTLFAQVTRQHEFLKSLEAGVKEQIETTIPRVIQEVTKTLERQLKIDAAQMEAVIKDNLMKCIGGPQVREAISAAATNAAKPALEHAFKDSFTAILLPGLEKACQNMFKQVQDAFLVGTREYLQNVDSIMDKQYQRQSKTQSEALASVVREELQSEFCKGLSMMQENTVRSVRDCVRENFTQHMSEISGIRSRATTPGLTGPTQVDAQARVMSLLQRGQLNAAFQQALSASDLNLVVLVCENTDTARVFSCSMGSGQGSRCVLQQPVLLSLVQQLSANLGHRTELKHRWLEEAVISLDPNDPVIREHMLNVLLSLQSQIATFITANPNHRSVRRLKMVAMAAQALLKPS